MVIAQSGQPAWLISNHSIRLLFIRRYTSNRCFRKIFQKFLLHKNGDPAIPDGVNTIPQSLFRQLVFKR